MFDPAVKHNDSIIINNLYDNTHPTSVQKKQYEDPKTEESHHSTNSVNGEGNKDNSKSIEVNHSEEISLNRSNIGKLI